MADPPPDKPPPDPQPIPIEQIVAIANSGAGSLADLAKTAGGSFMLDADTARAYGAGFVSDLLRMAAAEPSILDNPPPAPAKLDPQVPNGYEQAKEDGNAV